MPLMERFEPQLFLISAGYDSHFLDPLASLDLASTSFYKMAFILSSLSHIHCHGRMGIFLEGGYEYAATAESVLETIRGCQDLDSLKDFSNKKDIKDFLKINYGMESAEITNPGLLLKLKKKLKI